jgi:hypothetical protein
MSLPKAAFVPPELGLTLAKPIQELADCRIVFPVAFFLLATTLFLASRTHSIWIYFVPPALGPLLGSLVLVLEPFNPYRNLFAELEALKPPDTMTDSRAKCLLTLLGSKTAHAIVIRSGVLLTIILCGIMGINALLNPQAVKSSVEPVDLVFDTFLFWASSMYLHLHFLLAWAFREWPKQMAGLPAGK